MYGMAIFEAFWKRQKRLRGDLPDVYVYDKAPEALRVQIIHVMMEVLGDGDAYNDHYGRGDVITETYKIIVSTLRRELGVFQLPHRQNRYREDFLAELVEFMLGEQDIERFLGAVELVCRLIENRASSYDYRRYDNAVQLAKSAIDEINARFREHGIGFEYDGEIIRIDTELVHAEAVKPALALLREKRYAGAEQEFLSAYSHYRKGDNKEALTNALKALESTMKIICAKRGWEFAATDSAKKLIQACMTNGLIPSFWQSHFTSLRSMLEASVPTARNKTSGHGQGAVTQTVPDHLASYVLQMTASTIVFLVKAEQALP